MGTVSMSLLWQTVTGTVKVLKNACNSSLHVSVSIFIPAFFAFFPTTHYNPCIPTSTQTAGTWNIRIHRRILIAEYFISLYWTYFTCVHLDPADGYEIWSGLSIPSLANSIWLSPFFFCRRIVFMQLHVKAKFPFQYSSHDQDSHTHILISQWT